MSDRDPDSLPADPTPEPMRGDCSQVSPPLDGITLAGFDDPRAWEPHRRLFEGLSVGFLLIRSDMTLEWINAAGVEMLGGNAAETMIGRVLYEAVPALAKRKPIYERVLRGESVDVPKQPVEEL